MICDVLNAHASGAMRACRLMKLQSVGIVTDIPGMIVDQKTDSALRRFVVRQDIRNIRLLSHLVLLTEAMCDIINPNREKPYIVIEGLVDSSLKEESPTPYPDEKRHITYTGTLNERYGVRDLIEGFMMLKQKDIVLDIYGSGPMERDIPRYVAEDNRICFHGVVPIEQAIVAQRSSYLLVNPRPSKEDFTKYSFPSKNMEYMATGVPLLTAALPGMPKEYYPFVFLFADESPMGISCRMNDILLMDKNEVSKRGLEGKHFVMENKNNIFQAKQVLSLITRDCE